MAENDGRGRGRDLAGVTLLFGEEYEVADRRIGSIRVSALR